jgi:hypothetical protein
MKTQIKVEEAKALLQALKGENPNRAYPNGLTYGEQSRAVSAYKKALRRLQHIVDHGHQE